MKIAMLVSGGVDSSVALKLLRDEGHEIIAFYLKIWLEDETAFLGTCPWEEDLKYARAVCKRLDVPLEVVPLQKEYYGRVVAYALDEVRAGRTPNPDVLCNSYIKYGAFLEWLDKQGKRCDKVATGHYAQVVDSRKSKVESGESLNFILKKSPDPVKDQTYFLSRLSERQLARALFPIGGYTKEEVRKMAKEFDLPTKDRPDSQGLCFLGEINYNDFVRHHLGERKGTIIDQETGKALGTHKGYWFHTIGQRHGLNLSGGPWYVIGKNIEKNIVYVSHRLKMHEVERKEFDVDHLTGSIRKISGNKGRSTVKVRHGAREYPCELSVKGDKGYVKLLEDAERGIAPGQFAVFYDGEICLGSGVISE